MVGVDLLANGEAHGSVASRLLQYDFDPNCLKPWLGQDGRSYLNVNTGRKDDKGKPLYVAQPTNNANATLLKNEWIQLEEAVQKAGRQRLQVFGDLRARNSFTIPNGMGKTILESQRRSKVRPATISMDGLRRGDSDRPVYDLVGLPLPMIYTDYDMTLRQLQASRNGSSALDTSMLEESAIELAEEVEKMTLGVSSAATLFTYGGYTIYGMTNFPDRNTKVLADPTQVGWTPADTVADVLNMKLKSQQDFKYGPWRLYTSMLWDQYLDDDYSAAKGDNTLRNRIKMIQGIEDVVTSDFLENYDMVLVQMQAGTARAVVAMEMQLLSWDFEGGLGLRFKLVCMLIPQFRSDFYGNCGIVHGAI